MRRISLLAIALLTCSLAMTFSMVANAWTPNPAVKGKVKPTGTLVVSNHSEWDGFNPAVAYYTAGQVIHRNIHSQLVTHACAMDLPVDDLMIPDLAESWEVSKDGKTFTFHLRDAKWHDGSQFTSADVLYTFQGFLDRKNPGPYTVVGAIDTMSAPDARTFIVTLKKPSNSFIQQLAYFSPGDYILKKSLYENTDWVTNPYNWKPVGTGAYKLVEYVKGDHVTVVANEYWWGEGPYIEKIIVKVIPYLPTAITALEAGEIDEIYGSMRASEIGRFATSATIQAVKWEDPDVSYLGFNCAKKPYTDVRVREAIGHALDKEEINKRVYLGMQRVSNWPWRSSVPMFNPNAKLPEFNLEKANKLLDEAGYPRGSDGIRFTTTLMPMPWADYPEFCLVIKEQLKKIGVDVDIRILDNAAYEDKKIKGDYDLDLFLMWFGPTAKINSSTSGGKLIRPQGNTRFYDNPEVDRLYIEGDAEIDMTKSNQLYYRLQEILAKDLPYITVIENSKFLLKNRKYIGFCYDPEGAKPGSEVGGNRYVGFRQYHRVRLVTAPVVTTTLMTTAVVTTAATPGPETYVVGAVVAVALIAAVAFLARKRKKS